MKPLIEPWNNSITQGYFPCGWLILILIVAWLALFSGINTIPVEQHEAYVLQTAREMSRNGDFIVPYFNDQPRMNKPPLNYWLTMTASALDPFTDDIEPWHGRIWSMIGCLLLLVATLRIGDILYGAPAGFLASALLLGTKGFVDFSHDARPDCLYSVLCVLMLYAWIAAWRSVDDSCRQKLFALVSWIFAGLAVLSKGPQVPAVLLAGFLLFLVAAREHSRIFKILRPFSGIPLCLAICLPWWFLLKHRVALLGIDFSKTQLSGSLLTNISGLREIFGFFYVSRLLNILLPVSLLLPLLAYLNRKKFSKAISNI